MSEAQYNTGGPNQSEQDKLLSELLQKFTERSQAPAPSPAQSTSATTGAPAPDMLSSLLSNPELIAKLPQMMSAIKPMLDMLGKPAVPSNATASQDTAPTSALPAFPAATAKTKNDSDRAALLCAMKPYLSQDRQNAIDYIIKLSRLGDILKTL